MPTQKWCNQLGCKEFIFTKLDDFDDNGWGAFQIPAGKGKILCYCPKHIEDMKIKIKETLTKGVRK